MATKGPIRQHQAMARGESISQGSGSAMGRRQFKEGGSCGFAPHKDTAYSPVARRAGFKKGGRSGGF